MSFDDIRGLKYDIGELEYDLICHEYDKFKELKSIFSFIKKADIEELTAIVSEIIRIHENMIVHDENTGLLIRVEGVENIDDGICLLVSGEN